MSMDRTTGRLVVDKKSQTSSCSFSLSRARRILQDIKDTIVQKGLCYQNILYAQKLAIYFH